MQWSLENSVIGKAMFRDRVVVQRGRSALYNAFYFAKDLLPLYVRSCLHLRVGNRGTVCFVPQKPSTKAVIRKICIAGGYRTVGVGPLSADVIVRWEYETTPKPFSEYVRQHDVPVVINRNCVDVSKRTIERCHEEVFGYSLTIDPTVHRGTAVVKSNVNGAHDGRLIDTPVDEFSSDLVYQRCVANVTEEGYAEDIRLPIFGDVIPFAYLKYRPISSRFSNTNSHVELAAVDSVISAEEQEKILYLCRIMGMEYGEVDVVRDRSDHRVYVLDLNNTPSGPPNGLAKEGMQKAIKALSETWDAMISRTST